MFLKGLTEFGGNYYLGDVFWFQMFCFVLFCFLFCFFFFCVMDGNFMDFVIFWDYIALP